MGKILTEALVSEAIDWLHPSIMAMLAEEEAAWGPHYISLAVAGPGLNQPLRVYIGKPNTQIDWNPKWGEFSPSAHFEDVATKKCQASRRNGEPTSVTIALHPEKFEIGEYLYPGGVAEEKGGLAVGVSGLHGFVDEWIAWWVYHTIVTLCQQGAEARIKNDDKRI